MPGARSRPDREAAAPGEAAGLGGGLGSGSWLRRGRWRTYPFDAGFLAARCTAAPSIPSCIAVASAMLVAIEAGTARGRLAAAEANDLRHGFAASSVSIEELAAAQRGELLLPGPGRNNSRLVTHCTGYCIQVRRSLASSMVHVVSGANSGGILCELSTSSPMAHMPPLQDLAEVGGHSIIPISQLSGSQQLEARPVVFWHFCGLYGTVCSLAGHPREVFLRRGRDE